MPDDIRAKQFFFFFAKLMEIFVVTEEEEGMIPTWGTVDAFNILPACRRSLKIFSLPHCTTSLELCTCLLPHHLEYGILIKMSPSENSVWYSCVRVDFELELNSEPFGSGLGPDWIRLSTSGLVWVKIYSHFEQRMMKHFHRIIKSRRTLRAGGLILVAVSTKLLHFFPLHSTSKLWL